MTNIVAPFGYNPPDEETVSADIFRNGMAALSSAVTVVTTDGPHGPHGFTASAVCSVSDTPPTLLVCVNRSTSAHPYILEHGVLAINVLHEGQDHLSNAFSSRSRSMAERFAAGKWHKGLTGAPVLDDALVSFDCRIREIRDVGTHTVIIAHVVDVTMGETGTRSGLVWFNRQYSQTIPK
ncbi:flavin mononucleotide (FMN) reductase [Acetobacter pasteurianus NBRC 101655]|uniref:flavin reductase n=1 Tax=Acetobacter pasteurianus TaxID=438 RepID=UPI00024578B3|nr:flavin reductase [Acetobacter pasteurianus]BAU38485.1 flavin mononucleotide (FMN) reductase [Acetobacter pasteurianus NBRC 101655]CCT58384.1 4-hydroxyphenylacetate-3-hydroxylase [Acetobacter pasteurianus 386B]